MIKYLLFIFTVVCKPGSIYDNNLEKVTELQDPDGTSDYFYFNDIELEEGVYLYVSKHQDSVFFLIEGNEFDYVFEDDKNTEFQILR